MKLRITLVGVCALAVLGAVAGSASAAAPYGPFTMRANPVEPAGDAVTFQIDGYTRFVCKSSLIEGTHQAPSATIFPWTETSMKFISCREPRLGEEATVTVPVLPKMLAQTWGAARNTRVTFPETKVAIKFFTCELQLSGSLIGEGPGAPTTSEAFTAQSSALKVTKATSLCNQLLMGVGQSATMAVNYTSTPIGS